MLLPISSSHLTSVFPLLFFVSILFTSSLFPTNRAIHFPTQKQYCVHAHFTALLNLKLGFHFSNYSVTPLSSWNPNNTNCCSWEAVTCNDTTGHVIGLDLSNSHVSGWIDFEILFHIPSLQRLNLASTSFHSSPIPAGFDQLTALTHLNLSHSSSFSGQIPLEISHLTGLVSLDLSYTDFMLKNPNLQALVQNLSRLRELRLDGVDIGMSGSEWDQALSSALPSLEKLSLSDCNLSGSIPSSLSKLHSLSELDLRRNNLSSNIPSFVGNFSSLLSLNLAECELHGTIPSSLFSLPSLQWLDLSVNHLRGQLGELHNASTSLIQRLDLHGNDFQGPIPRWIFQLPQLTSLDLSANNFTGVLDISLLKNLKRLDGLDLSDNNLSIINKGSNSSLISFPQMSYLSLRSCNLTEFPDILRNQEHLVVLDLSKNRINSGIPQWVWNTGNKTLLYINLSQNALEGFEGPFPHPSFLSSLHYLDLGSNKLQGSLPSLIFKATSLLLIDLSNNSFSRGLNQTFRKGCRLEWLYLNENQLKGPLPRSLVNCTRLKMLNLRENQVNDTFPFWLQKNPQLIILMLRSNQFYGSLSHPTLTPTFLGRLRVFDISVNSFTGSLPSNAFEMGCQLNILNLQQNQFEGPLPHSLAHCTELIVVALGENRIRDSFPFWLQNLPNLLVLILRSNQFHGNITPTPIFKHLEIFDLASNSFSGSLPSNVFKTWEAMRESKKFRMPNPIQSSTLIKFNVVLMPSPSMNLVMKRIELKYARVPDGFAFIDLSSNIFDGKIPESVGDLKSLRSLNMSYNNFRGEIPESVGKLKNLESLDLSQNDLSGEIPKQLADVTTLAVLNVSYNGLVGGIPHGPQFATFTKDSFLGNPGLCGPPLSKPCEKVEEPSNDEYEESDDEFEWRFIWIGFGVGYGVGLGILFWTLAVWRDGKRRFYLFFDRMLCLIFPSARSFL